MTRYARLATLAVLLASSAVMLPRLPASAGPLPSDCAPLTPDVQAIASMAPVMCSDLKVSGAVTLTNKSTSPRFMPSCKAWASPDPSAGPDGAKSFEFPVGPLTSQVASLFVSVKGYKGAGTYEGEALQSNRTQLFLGTPGGNPSDRRTFTLTDQDGTRTLGQKPMAATLTIAADGSGTLALKNAAERFDKTDAASGNSAFDRFEYVDVSLNFRCVDPAGKP